MIPRYRATGQMLQDASGTYVGAADFDRVADELMDLGQFVIHQFEKAKSGEITAEDAIASAAVTARLKGCSGPGQR